MSMRAMWITGCRSTVESVFMMRTGEANSEARYISTAEARMYQPAAGEGENSV